MSQLKVITDKEAWNKEHDYSTRSYVFRSAVRLVLTDNARKVAVLNVSKHNYYTLPGGGIDFGESILEALHREAKEETGCTIEEISELGEVLETRYKPHKGEGLVQINFAYLANLKEILGEPIFIETEVEAGYRLEWLEIDEAIQKIARGSTGDYPNRFTQLRDVAILEKANSYLSQFSVQAND